MRISLLLSTLLIFTACASSPPPAEKEEAGSIDNCLAHPELADAWGECNVKKTIYDNLPRIRSCVENSKSKGTMMLKISLKPNGAVKSLRPEAGGPRNKLLEKCLSRAFNRVKFATPPAGVKPVIYFPLDLGSGS